MQCKGEEKSVTTKWDRRRTPSPISISPKIQIGQIGRFWNRTVEFGGRRFWNRSYRTGPYSQWENIPGLISCFCHNDASLLWNWYHPFASMIGHLEYYHLLSKFVRLSDPHPSQARQLFVSWIEYGQEILISHQIVRDSQWIENQASISQFIACNHKLTSLHTIWLISYNSETRTHA